ncbi:hypothetical protein C6P43_000866 [Kluyveromyces marxianus]|nr:hypothetical protein C6P43_000866 [Kluyveromyces marxianus]
MNSPSAHYTLPGVMHYLQTEYTKNERDRINWELERCEMKSRIAKLEGENRDLRTELAKLETKLQSLDSNNDNAIGEPEKCVPAESWEQEQELLDSKLSVQENIKEIVYLLKSPPVMEQLDSWNNKDDPVKRLEALNLFNNKGGENGENGSNLANGNHGGELNGNGNNNDKSNDSASGNTADFNTAGSGSGSTGGNDSSGNAKTSNDGENDSSILFSRDWNDVPTSNMSSLGDNSDAETVVNTRRSRSSSLFSSGSNEAITFHTYRFLQYHLSAISGLKAMGNNLLSFGSDGLLKHWLIEPNLNSNEKATKAFHSVPNLLGIFWLNKTRFMTVDEMSVKLWNIDQSEPLVSWDALKDLVDLQSVDFKNGWLILTFVNEIKVWEIKVGEASIDKLNEYIISVPNKILNCLLGLTEKSLIILNGDSKHNVKVSIFEFQGSLLQQIDLSHTLSQFHATNNELALNRSTSKLLIRFESETLIYSFDQKKTILVFSTPQPAVSSIFLNDLDYTATALKDGTIIVKSIKEGGKQVKIYNHYEHPEKTPAGVQPITISSTVIDKTPVIVSGGYNGVIRLEKVMNL